VLAGAGTLVSMSDHDQQLQVMAVAKILEAADAAAQQNNLAPPLTVAGLAIATGSFAGLHGLSLEEVLDVVARAYNGARQGVANAQAGTGDVVAGAAPEVVPVPPPAEPVFEGELVEAPAELVAPAGPPQPKKKKGAKR